MFDRGSVYSCLYIITLLVYTVSEEAVADLWSEAQVMMTEGIRDSTKCTYSSAQKEFINFVIFIIWYPYQQRKKLLMMFVTYMYKKHYKYNSVKVYLFAIRHMHIVNGFENPLLNTPRLQLSLRALHNKCKTPVDKLPITHQILYQIFNVLADPPTYDEKLIWSAMTLGFFWFAQRGRVHNTISICF